MSTTYNSNVMAEFRDHVVISSWTGSVTPAMQDMLRLTTNGTDYMQQFLSTENQYRTALSVLSSAGAARIAAMARSINCAQYILALVWGFGFEV